ncbi:hypothetical protein Glove_306g57 [Diversispora epigaea]|uniref:BTB domain-containing protein n=1 Tax=Diversispora epigaea TaxID=1348612 RepID=A0A397I000_9GLOM|nr:hypothetical protein Glove_306g57 [Diversispora epigaea]
MTDYLLTLLSKDYQKLFESREFADITIQVGEEPNETQVFKAHSTVLRIRSSYFRTEILKSDTNNLSIDGINIILNHSNISPEIFETLLRYIYVGNIELTKYDIPEILNILIVANKLGLTDLCDYIQDQLLDSKKELLKQNFVHVNRTSISNGFEKLSKFCIKVLNQDPKIIFRSKGFTSFTSDELLGYYKDYFQVNNQIDQIEKIEQIEQIELWERLIEWGICQLPNMNSDNSKENFQALKEKVKPMMKYIEFKEISAKDFFQKIRPFRYVFDDDYYIQILESHAFTNIQPEILSSSSSSSPPPPPSSSSLSPNPSFNNLLSDKTLNQSPTYDASTSVKSITLTSSSSPLESTEPELLEMTSKLVTPIYFGLFTKWINEIDFKNNSFKFNLLLRGSYHGLNAKTFHNLCDYKGATITIVKVKDSNELIGGYNPLDWFRGYPPGIHDKTKKSFIFSLDQNDLNKSIFSKVIDEKNAIHQHQDFGPSFGLGRSDLRLYGMGLNDKKLCICNKLSYEKRIRSSKLEFGVEDYEVWQVVKE